MAIDIEAAGFTDQQWWAMCDVHLSLPVPLHEADLVKPFVYDRRWGVFYVPFGYHQQAMSTLYAFHQGMTSAIKAAQANGLNYCKGECADYWLTKIPGTAMRSSVGKQVLVGSLRNLTAIERRMLGAVIPLDA